MRLTGGRGLAFPTPLDHHDGLLWIIWAGERVVVEADVLAVERDAAHGADGDGPLVRLELDARRLDPLVAADAEVVVAGHALAQGAGVDGDLAGREAEAALPRLIRQQPRPPPAPPSSREGGESAHEAGVDELLRAGEHPLPEREGLILGRREHGKGLARVEQEPHGGIVYTFIHPPLHVLESGTLQQRLCLP